VRVCPPLDEPLQSDREVFGHALGFHALPELGVDVAQDERRQTPNSRYAQRAQIPYDTGSVPTLITVQHQLQMTVNFAGVGSIGSLI
jgi:hypothetical protein